MIKIEIVESIVALQKGVYSFFLNELSFSSSTQAKVIIPISCDSFELHIIHNKLFLLNPHHSEKILVNGKFIGEVSILKKNDSVSMEDFKFKVLEFEFSEKLKKNEVLNRNTDIIMQSKPKLYELIQKVRAK